MARADSAAACGIVWLALALGLGGCTSDDTTPTTDAASTDAAPADARVADLASPDGPATDMPASDAPLRDAAVDAAPADAVRLDGYGDALTASCAQLQQNYLTVLEQAKVCNPVLSIPQCMVRVDDELACPCDTYAQSTNEGPLNRLATIKGNWQQQGCGAHVACPPVPCPGASPNNCQPGSGNRGRCEN